MATQSGKYIVIGLKSISNRGLMELTSDSPQSPPPLITEAAGS